MSWSGTGRAYARSYAELCAGTVDELRRLLGQGEDRSLLEVGAGTGILAARLSVDGWDVTASEPEESMREVATEQYPALALVDAALPDLPFGTGQFDAVVANFVVNHVPDPRAAAAELLRVSRGSVVATIWTESPAWFWAEVTERSGLEPGPSHRLPPELDFKRSVAGFAQLLAESGWVPEVSELRWNWDVRPETLWASVEGGVAGAGGFYCGLGAEEKARFREAFDSVIAERAENGIVSLLHAAAVGWARFGRE